MAKPYDDPQAREQIARLLGDQPAFLTIDETASLLRISRRTLGKLLAAKRIKTVRYTSGGSARVLIPRSSIEAFIAANLDG